MVSCKLCCFWRMCVISLVDSFCSVTIRFLILRAPDMIHALGGHITLWNTRLIGFTCITSVTLVHIFQVKWGLRLQNAIALAKLGIMIFVILSGLLAFLKWIPLAEKPHNFENLWQGTGTNPNAFVAGLYNVIW